MEAETEIELRSRARINDLGEIIGTATYTPTSNSDPTPAGQHGVLLVPAEIIPLFDRSAADNPNGLFIDTSLTNSKDRGKVTMASPLRMWINNFTDNGDVNPTENDIPGGNGSIPNGQLHAINGTSDLANYFPVVLNIKQLLTVLPAGTCTYKLKNADGALNYALTNLTPATAGKYLTDTATANLLKNASTYVATPTGSVLTTKILNNFQSQDGYGVILLGGVAKTNNPLVLEVDDPTGKDVCELSLYVSVDTIENMYRSINLLNCSGGSGGLPTQLGVPSNYPDSLCNNSKFMFIHGYNVNPEQARGWMSAMFRRMYWAGSKAKFYGVTWNGSDSQIGPVTFNYQTNVEHAFTTAQALARYIDGNTYVLSHSLGNELVGSAINDWGASPAQWYMADAAMPLEVFDSSQEQISGQNGTGIGMENPNYAAYPRTPISVWAADWYKLFPFGDHRHGLTWKGRFAGAPNKTVIFNYYSSGEEVLNNPVSPTPSIPLSANQVWEAQERLKGLVPTGAVLTSNYGGWSYNPYYESANLSSGSGVLISPAQAASLTPAQLKANPFFDPRSSDTPMYTASGSGSNFAAPVLNGNRLIAEQVPALSYAAGRNNEQNLNDLSGQQSNFNMNTTQFQNGWPASRATNAWFHSDIGQVSYLFTYSVFQNFVSKGSLDR